MPTKEKFSCNDFEVVVSDAGVGHQGWEGGALAPKFNVTVRRGGAVYRSKAWGSQNDYREGKRDRAGIGAMVLDELASADADPDEFESMVIGEAKGRAAIARYKIAQSTIKAAKRLRAYEAGDKCRDESGELKLSPWRKV